MLKGERLALQDILCSPVEHILFIGFAQPRMRGRSAGERGRGQIAVRLLLGAKDAICFLTAGPVVVGECQCFAFIYVFSLGVGVGASRNRSEDG